MIIMHPNQPESLIDLRFVAMHRCDAGKAKVVIELIDKASDTETQNQRNMRAARIDTPKRIVEWQLKDFKQAMQVNRELQALANSVAYGDKVTFDIQELKQAA